MLVLEEIVRQRGSVGDIQKMGVFRVKRDGRILLLEYMGFGPTAEHAVRLSIINHFGRVGPEIHLERRSGIWMPYYLRNEVTGTELFLYRFVGIREPLYLDFEAGLRLIQATAILDFDLLADGFAQAAEEDLYHPLFSMKGGAA